MQWVGRQATVALPGHIDVYNAGPIRDELLSVINRGAQALIVDMSATISCDHAGADAVVRASQRAALGGTRLRLVVTDRIVSRVLNLSGLDRLVSIYPSLEAAMAASRAPVAVPALVPLVDALQDGIALTDDGGTITLASGRLEEMFGYEHAELPGHLVESLIPAGQLAGRRKDGTTFPAEISLNPVTTTGGSFTMVVIRDITKREHRDQELLDSVTASLFHAALSLQAAMALPAEAAREHLAAAAGYLDETIRELREAAFTTRGHETAPGALRT